MCHARFVMVAGKPQMPHGGNCHGHFSLRSHCKIETQVSRRVHARGEWVLLGCHSWLASVVEVVYAKLVDARTSCILLTMLVRDKWCDTVCLMSGVCWINAFAIARILFSSRKYCPTRTFAADWLHNLFREFSLTQISAILPFEIPSQKARNFDAILHVQYLSFNM